MPREVGMFYEVSVMQYQLSPVIDEVFQPMWLEGSPFHQKNLYNFEQTGPPVHYNSYEFKPHSLTHVESQAHTVPGGKTLDQYDLSYFIGKSLVIKLKGDGYRLVDAEKQIYHWIISEDELKPYLGNTDASIFLITAENSPYLAYGVHDPSYVLTLSEAAAKLMLKCQNFKAYGTSWKSSDYNPGSRDRKIHNLIFQKGIIYENLLLDKVSEGEYHFSGLPVMVKGSSEMVVNPIISSI